MTGPLDTYRSGTHEDAWRALAAQPGHPDAEAVARETAERLTTALQQLREGLPAVGWIFDDPERVLPGPDPAAADALDAFEQQIGPLPLALRMLALHVGPVDLNGHHPDWQVQYADPVVLDPFWSELLDEHAQNLEWGTFGEPGSDGTFPMPLAPDALHKADVSGGPPYAVALPSSTVDPPWLEDPAHPDTTLLGYLRSAVLTYGGVPGFQRQPDLQLPAGLAELAARLPRF